MHLLQCLDICNATSCSLRLFKHPPGFNLLGVVL